MRFGFALMALGKLAFSQGAEEEEEAAPQPQSVNLKVEYEILERPGPISVEKFLEATAPETFTLDYKIENIDEERIYNIVGVSGAIMNAFDRSEAGALSPQNFESVDLLPGKSAPLRQEVQLTLKAGRYYVLPYVHIQEDGEVKRVMVTPFAIEMLDPAMSTFDLSFLSVLAMIAALAGGAYYFYSSTIAPPPKLKKKNAVPVKVDESWLPDVHKK